MDDDDDTQVYKEDGNALLIAYQSGYYDGKKAAQPVQRTRVVLTDKEIEAIWKVALFADYGVGAELSNQPFVHYARAIEAKLKEKNT